jgi:Tol biopolymer transport system component
MPTREKVTGAAIEWLSRGMWSRAIVPLGCLLALAGAVVAQNAPKPARYYNSSWSPDGKQLLFESTRDGKYSLYTVRLDGTGLQRLTVDTVNNETASWSPDGKEIAFSSDRDGHSDIYVMHADGSGVRRLHRSDSGTFYNPRFSPDGRQIVFQGRFVRASIVELLFVVSSDGSRYHQLTDSTRSSMAATWSPEGRWILFSQQPVEVWLWKDATPEQQRRMQQATRLMAVHANGSGLREWARGPGPIGRPSWTTDGKTIYFRATVGTATSIFAMNPDGTNVRRITGGETVETPTPSPDGRYFTYAKEVAGVSGVYVYDIATRTERLVISGRDTTTRP